MDLALRTSTASMPGAFVENDASTRFPKPSQRELIATATRDAGYPSSSTCSSHPQQHPADDEPPHQLAPNEAISIDDLQVRMKSFQVLAEIEDIEAKQQRKKKRNLLLVTIGIVILIVAIGTTVGILEVKKNGGNPDPGKNLSSFDATRCYSRNEERLVARYHDFRSEITSRFPLITTAIDTPYSPASVALCWLSDYDDFPLEISQGYDNINSTQLIQRYALSVIYYHFENSTEKGRLSVLSGRNWLGSTHVCSWDFVECPKNTTDESQRNIVQGLDITVKDLFGNIPSELALLTNLVHLEFADENSITGEIPSELWTLTLLQELIIPGGSTLFGTIPSELMYLRQLVRLNLLGASIEGTIPDLSPLSKLTSLVFGGGFVQGPFPNVTELTNLGEFFGFFDDSGANTKHFYTEELYLETPEIDGSIPSDFWSLTKLGKCLDGYLLSLVCVVHLKDTIHILQQRYCNYRLVVVACRRK